MDKVVFDTNAYRYLVKGRSMDDITDLVSDLKEKEKRKNIETLLSPIVAQELLSHLLDKNDPSFERCLKANKALYLHNGNPQSCNLLPSFEVMLGKIYFNAVPEKRIETYNAIVQLSYNFAVKPFDDAFEQLENNLKNVKQQVDEGEAGFVLSMIDLVAKCDPEAVGWQIFKNDKLKRKNLLRLIRTEETSLNMALGYLATTQYILGESGHEFQLSAEQLKGFARHLITTFPEPISLFKDVIENLINSEFNIMEKSRSNFVWDIALMFNAGNHTIGNSKLYFVTADKAIIRTAQKNIKSQSILTFDEYMERLRD